MTDRPYKTRCNRLPDGRHELSYGRGRKKLTVRVIREDGVYFAAIDTDMLGLSRAGYDTLRALKAAWGERAAAAYAGESVPPAPCPVQPDMTPAIRADAPAPADPLETFKPISEFQIGLLAAARFVDSVASFGITRSVLAERILELPYTKEGA